MQWSCACEAPAPAKEPTFLEGALVCTEYYGIDPLESFMVCLFHVIGVSTKRDDAYLSYRMFNSLLTGREAALGLGDSGV